MSRLDPIPPKEWPPEMRDALAPLRPADSHHPAPPREGRSKGLNALGTFAHHPALTRAFNTFNGHILFSTTLSPRQRELVVLRVAALRRCQYEWAQHVILAGDAGLSAEEIARVGDGPDADGWAPIEGALIRAADELVSDAAVSDETWDVLAADLDEQQLLDVVFTVGAYDLVAMMFLTAGVELDDDLVPAPLPAVGPTLQPPVL